MYGVGENWPLPMSIPLSFILNDGDASPNPGKRRQSISPIEDVGIQSESAPSHQVAKWASQSQPPERTSSYGKLDQYVAQQIAVDGTAATQHAIPVPPSVISEQLATYHKRETGEVPFCLLQERGALFHRRRIQSGPQYSWKRMKNPGIDESAYGISGPPSPEADMETFNIFEALFGYPDLVFRVGAQLDVEDLVSLYAISRDFHLFANGHFTALISAHAQVHAPESAHCFLFRCYQPLCQSDPAGRPNAVMKSHTRDVPTFRWLRMVVWREQVVDDIINSLAAAGFRFPPRASLVLKKIWFVMDIPDNGRRISLFHNRSFWADADLYLATMIFIRLDMFFNDPLEDNGSGTLRGLMMAQSSLTVLRDVLQGKKLRSMNELLAMYTEWRFDDRFVTTRVSETVFGVPRLMVGRLLKENYNEEIEGDPEDQLIMRPDQLVEKEAMKRKFPVWEHYCDMMLWGFADRDTFEDVVPSGRADVGTKRSVSPDQEENTIKNRNPEKDVEPDRKGYGDENKPDSRTKDVPPGTNQGPAPEPMIHKAAPEEKECCEEDQMSEAERKALHLMRVVAGSGHLYMYSLGNCGVRLEDFSSEDEDFDMESDDEGSGHGVESDAADDEIDGMHVDAAV